MLAARLALVGIILMLNGCAISSAEVDTMCREIAAFANASGSTAHSVRLTTWGGVYTEAELPDEWRTTAQDCEHDDYEPGKKLCGYLLEDTSLWFPITNYQRALRCLGFRASGRSSTVDHKLPLSAAPRHASGVRRGVLVKVELLPATDTEPATDTAPATLKISVPEGG